MGNAWTVEYWRIGLVIISVLLIGSLTGYWYLAWIIPLVLYIAWHLRQLYLLESWLRKGTKTRKAPETNGVWALIVQQIFRRKQKERKQKKRLAATLGRFNATASALPDATVVLNNQQEIEWMNLAAGEILGIDRKSDVGLRIDTLIRAPEFNQWMNRPWKQEDLEMQSPHNSSQTLVFRRVKFGKGQSLLTARDVSQRIQLQKMRKAFIANASHELRTPLTVIAGYLEIIESIDELPDSLKEPVINAGTQARRMQDILEDLLSLSKLESSDLSEKGGTRLKAAELLQEIVSDMQKTLAVDSHELRLDVESALNIRAVESEFTSVAVNLVKNAIQHTPDGTLVEIVWKPGDKGTACLIVEDNGPGIAAKDLPKLTERFYRIDSGRSREKGGTGLGLSIVKHVMERHGGSLDIYSEPGKGACFRACFPAFRVMTDQSD